MIRTTVTAAAAGFAAGAVAGAVALREAQRRRRPSRPGLAVILGDDAWILGKLAAAHHRMDGGDHIEGIALSVATADGEYASYVASKRQGPDKVICTPVSTPWGLADMPVVMPEVPDDPRGCA